MAAITLKGNPIETIGELPQIGSTAPDFVLTNRELQDVTLQDFAGKKKILNIIHSLDTGVCANSARRFEQEIRNHPDTVVLTISCDLPFAQRRFCDAESISQIVTLSQLRDRRFGKDYGVEMISGPLKGLTARALVVLNTDNRVVYTEQVRENTEEPDYQKALSAL